MISIAFDLHGTLDRNQTFFKPMLKLLYKSRVRVYILSGPKKDQIKDELSALGYIKYTHYHEILSVVDYLKSVGTTMWQDEKGNWCASKEDWWPSKAEICKRYIIDSLIDDKVEYKKYFKDTNTTFILWEGTV